ncbi:MAG TPA: T9SS type A sorting domain-containing protein, partial [Bacteroidetes bacterium]|nr:T9SS type A sorting domain-containing protein [Bacteroidota bacterium]
NDFTPYILTAEHCISLSDTDPNDWVFRFNYESATCEETVAPHKSLYYSYSGATLKAYWTDSDFALLQLNSSTNGNNSFAGWNRQNTIPPNSTCIHHPGGDVKKISIDDQAPVVNGMFHNVVWDQGTTEEGSSGSALFDNNRLIIGQLSGGDASCENPSGTDEYGRIFDSWTGGGTITSRLSDWLGGVNNPNSVNTLIPPSISGSRFLCTTMKTYILHDPIPSYIVTWSVSPTSLFGSATSGNGTAAELWAINSSVQGYATLTFTLENADCGSQFFTKRIWVGKPLLTGIQKPDCFDPGENYVLIADAEGGEHFEWSFPSCPNGDPSIPDPECWFNYTGNAQQVYVYTGQQGGYISVWATNPCGTSSINVPIGKFCDETPGHDVIFRSDDSDHPEEGIDSEDTANISVFPNPVSETVSVRLNNSLFKKEVEKAFSLYGVNGKSVHTGTAFGNKWDMDVSGLATGVYYLKIVYHSKISIHRIIIQ